MSNKIPSQFRVKKEYRHLLDKKVIICVPTRGNDIYWRLVAFLIQQYHTWPEIRVLFGRCSFQNPGMSMLKYIEDRDYDYAFFVDADVGPSWDVILHLMVRDKPIITAPVYMFEPNAIDIHFNVHYNHQLGPVHEKGKGVEKIYSSSFASLLIKREVLDAFKANGEAYTEWSPLLEADLKEYPPDVQFFAKCQRLGFDAFVDWDFTPCVHHKYVELSDQSLDMFTLRKADYVRELVDASTS